MVLLAVLGSWDKISQRDKAENTAVRWGGRSPPHLLFSSVSPEAIVDAVMFVEAEHARLLDHCCPIIPVEI